MNQEGKNMYKKILISFGITILFLGVGIQPAIATVEPKEDIKDVEPKDYLFQTIIDIANNPDVKELFEQYEYDLLKVDKARSIYRKILFRNPRLFFNTLLTKPSITYDYLDKSYNKGIEITNIIGNDIVLEMIESIGVTDIEIFDKLNKIIMNDEELSDRISILKEINKELNPDDTSLEDFPYPIICSILMIILLPVIFLWLFLSLIYNVVNEIANIFYGFLDIIDNIIYFIFDLLDFVFDDIIWVFIAMYSIIPIFFGIVIGCWEIDWYWYP